MVQKLPAILSSTVEKKKKKNHVTIGGRNIFDQPIENDLKICDNIRKIATGHSDDYTN